jgi:hypothetical protein
MSAFLQANLNGPVRLPRPKPFSSRVSCPSSWCVPLAQVGVSCALALLATVISIGPARAEVYVNMLWDERINDFKVKELVLEGSGQTWDREFQNAYGEYMGLEPGPPFIVQCNVRITNICDEDRKVTDWGSLTIQGGGIGLLDPFAIIFAPDDDQSYCEGAITSYGHLSFVGTSLDPIIFKGKYQINTHRPGNADP